MVEAYDLRRFLLAQDGRDGMDTIYERALEELRAGRKETHWMWFIFPQLAGLGSSFMAQKYAISSLDEARAYLEHPVLGPRLRACVAALNAVEGRTAREIMDFPDNLKLHSCLTLFVQASEDSGDFKAALAKYFDGALDVESMRILREAG
jgi:uncharacterized protein (DUF1810 family)